MTTFLRALSHLLDVLDSAWTVFHALPGSILVLLGPPLLHTFSLD
jgi:hypothetical protein